MNQSISAENVSAPVPVPLLMTSDPLSGQVPFEQLVVANMERRRVESE